jgi:hypothetical protein
MSRFEDEERQDFGPVVEIDEMAVVLRGGGDYYNGDTSEIDDETWAKARAIASKYDMEITSASGAWWGYSEYTPDPGDVVVFQWRPVKS